MKRRRWILAALLPFLLASLPAPAARAAEPGKRALTLMVYMCGSNLESQSGAGSLDITEMANSGYDVRNVNVLVMTGGSRLWALGQPADSLCVYNPGRGGARMLEAFESASMGEPATLATLLEYGYAHFPAEKYALILWDHGGGPMNGVCVDELYQSDSLTLAELYTALSASPAASQRLEWIGFDACLMGSAEVAAAMRPFARYMIASEETEPGTGWDYGFLEGIEADADGAATGRRIVDRYFDTPRDGFVMTLSCVDLDGLEALQASMDALFGSLEVSGGNYASFSYAAGSTRAFGRAAEGGYSYDLIDLSELVDALAAQAPQAARGTAEALERCVVYARSSADSGGLSIYHPYLNKQDYAQRWSALYPTLGFSEGYAGYIARFADYLFGSTAVSWEGLRGAPTDEPGVYALPLSRGQADSVLGAEMNVLRWNGDDGVYSRVCAVNQLAAEDGVIYGADPGIALVAVDGDGRPLTGAIPYDVLDDGSLGVYVNYCAAGAEDTEAAAALIDVNTRRLTKDFGSYSFDTEEVGSEGLPQSAGVTTDTAGADVDPASLNAAEGSALSQVLAATSLTVSPLTPLDAEALEALTVPEAVSLNAGSPYAVASGGFSLFSASSGQGEAAVTPVQGEALDATPSFYRMDSVGAAVDLDTLTPIGVEAFSPDQVELNLDAFSAPSGTAQGQAAVVHAYLSCRVDEEGRLAVGETWLYDEASGLWSTRGEPDLQGYPVLSFPVPWKLPTARDGVLAGYDSWETRYTTARQLRDHPLRLRLLPDETPADRCVSFQVTDLQSRAISSVPLME